MRKHLVAAAVFLYFGLSICIVSVMPLSFEYKAGKPATDPAWHEHQATVPAVKGQVYVYVSFKPLETNPLPNIDKHPTGMQVAAVGYYGNKRNFMALVRFGIV